MNAEQAAALRALVDDRGTRFTGTGYRDDLANVVEPNTGRVVLDDPLAEYSHYLDSVKR